MTTPTEKPISYSDTMIRARREGRKSQTRRVAKDPHFGLVPERTMTVLREHAESGVFVGRASKGIETWRGTETWRGECPHDVGGRAWIRENHKLRLAGKQYEAECLYVANGDKRIVSLTENDWIKLAQRKRAITRDFGPTIPARFMFRSLSRDTDLITGIRCERLQDISEDDARAEGAVECFMDRTHPDFRAGAKHSCRDDFQLLWESLYGPGSWALNSWVWVLEFKKL